jgi:hypothetical protein
LIDGGREKIESSQAKASLVARRRGKFAPAKPGGRCMAVKHFPDFRGATPAAGEIFHKFKPVIVSASGD